MTICGFIHHNSNCIQETRLRPGVLLKLCYLCDNIDGRFLWCIKLPFCFFVLTSLFVLLLKSVVQLVLTSQAAQAKSHLLDEHHTLEILIHFSQIVLRNEYLVVSVIPARASALSLCISTYE